jgi:hypothetical protein
MAKHKYTLYGSEELHTAIDQDIELINNSLKELLSENCIEALVLIGGYGRGEGTVQITNNLESPFNDYDFFVVTKYKLDDSQKHLLKQLEKSLTAKVGLEVDLYPIDKKSFINSPPSLMNYELLSKSIIALGNQNILQEMTPCDINQLPISEGTRLLLNRGMLLIYSKERLAQETPLTEDERQQLIKYILKAMLAIGDSYLLTSGQYHYSYLEKIERINKTTEIKLQNFELLRQKYLEAVDFKMKVDFTIYRGRDIKTWLDESLKIYEEYFRWFEEKRLQTGIPSWNLYQQLISKNSFPKSFLRLAKNVLLNIRQFGLLHVLKHPLWSLCYPRARLLALLPLFLRNDLDAQKENLFLINIKQEKAPQEVFNHFWSIWLKYS